MSIGSDTKFLRNSQPPQIDDDRVEVYRFELWDRAQGKNIAAPHMATPATIRRMKGEADLSSKQIVNKAALDCHGFYSSDVAAS